MGQYGASTLAAKGTGLEVGNRFHSRETADSSAATAHHIPAPISPSDPVHPGKKRTLPYAAFVKNERFRQTIDLLDQPVQPRLKVVK